MADRDFPPPDTEKPSEDPLFDGGGGTTDTQWFEDDLLAPERPSRWRRWRGRIFKYGGIGFAIFMAVMVVWLALTVPIGRSLEPLEKPAMLYVSSDGQPVARHGNLKAEPVDAALLPAHVTGAFVAVEDRRFYDHFGIDLRGIGRAMVANAEAGAMRQGGSTITQQLAKNVYTSGERNMARKLREVPVALWLELWLTKDEILSRYLSAVYFGEGQYGLRAAAKHYFDRAPEELTVGEAAMLAGLLKAPTRYAPTNDMERARARARIVLGEMAEAGVITEAEATAVRMPELRGRRPWIRTGSYFSEWIDAEVEAGIEPAFGLVEIPTTLDMRLQQIAVQATIDANLGDRQVGFVAMRPSGEVVALIGGRSHKRSPFNRATQAMRQPGSAFKLVVYMAALRSGWTPDDIIDDSPVTIDGYTPNNSDGRYLGPITLRQAFARSSNAAAVRLAQQVGRPAIERTARDLGIDVDLPPGPSYALGTAQIPLIEMTAAYAAIAGGTYPITPWGLPSQQSSATRRLDAWGEWEPMLDMLYAAANNGTGRRAALPIQTFGKTGTTQGNRDALFIGFAADLVVGVWVGHDDDRSLGNVTGGGLPASIWRDFMSKAIRVDGTRGPRLPRDFRPRPAPPQVPQRIPVPRYEEQDDIFDQIGREIEGWFEWL